MTEQRREEAFGYIEGQLDNGYIDLGFHDADELEIIREAIKLLKTVDEFNNIGCTSFMLTPEKINELIELGEIRPYDPIWDMYFDEFEDVNVINVVDENNNLIASTDFSDESKNLEVWKAAGLQEEDFYK